MDGFMWFVMMTNADPHDEAWWQACLGMAGLIVFLAALFIAIGWLGHQIKSVPEPETKHFPAATAEQSYSRTQHYWGDE